MHFVYSGLDEKGSEIKGKIDAFNITAARAQLRTSGVYVDKLLPEEEKTAHWEGLSRIRGSDIVVPTRQLTTLLGAGLPLTQAVSILIEQCEDKTLSAILDDIGRRLKEGQSFSDGLSAHPEVFPPFYVSMVRAGEVSGALEIILARLSEHMEKQGILKEKMRAALTYPALVAVVCIAVLFFLLSFVVPVVTRIFADMGQSLPLVTMLLVSIGGFFHKFWWVMLVAGCGIALLMKRLAKSERNMLWLDKLKLRIPLVGRLLQKYTISRFSRTLGTLISSGVPILTSLDIVRDVLGNRVFRKAIENVRTEVKEGESITFPLAKTGIFPSFVLRLISVGEKSARVEEMLERIANTYDEEVDSSLSRLVGLIEPAMVIIMGLAVGFVVLGVLLPIFEINQLVR